MILILGAGLSGLSAGYHLKQKGIDYRIFERENIGGGLCRTENESGFLFDYTGHFLHFRNEYAKNLVFSLMGENLEKHNRNSWIFSKGVYTPYPFQKNTYGLPKTVIRECLDGLKRRPAHQSLSHNFEDWIIKGFGKGIAKHFMFPYNTKLFTVHPKEMTAEWTGSYVPNVSIKEFINGAKKQRNIDNSGYNAFFYYPKKGGIGSLPNAFAKRVNGIELNTEIVKINISKKFVEIVSGEKYRYDKLISTIPLPELMGKINNVPMNIRENINRLDYVSVYNVNIGLNKKLENDKHWIYFPEEKYPFYRIGSMSNISETVAPKDCGSLYTEVSYSNHKPLPKDIDERIFKSLSDLDIIKSSDIVAKKTLDIKYAYIIYNNSWKSATESIKNYLSKKDILAIGRYGNWEYSAMEDAILWGKRAADWSVS